MDAPPPSPPELLHSAALTANLADSTSQNGHRATTSAVNTTHDLTADVQTPLLSAPSSINGGNFTLITKRKKKKKQTRMDAAESSSSSSSSCTASSFRHTYGGLRVSNGRWNPRLLIGSGRQRETNVEALALPLGMSIAAVIAQVLEKNDTAGGRMDVDRVSMIYEVPAWTAENLAVCTHLAGNSACAAFRCCYSDLIKQLVHLEICTMAVKESVINVFGDKFNSFTRNFEKSFRSTLMTLRSIKKSSQNSGADDQVFLVRESFHSRVSFNEEEDSICNSGVSSTNSDEVHGISSLERLSTLEEKEEKLPSYMLNHQLSLQNGQLKQQLACISSSGRPVDTYKLSTLEKSVIEQTRSNDLKTYEIGLLMKKLKLKETQLALSSDSNLLERCKLAMGVSKASFGAEKFKNQLKDARHAELLKTCIDCLVAGLFVMMACLAYGTYVYSHKRITEATASCMPTNVSKSWWMPKPMASFNMTFQILMCQVQVISRMLFGLLMIFAITYLLLQRSSTSQQTMPITFMLLLLGAICGFAGKLCIDTLGGSGYHWLFYWEALCLLHFFSNFCTSALYFFLYGPIAIMPDRTKAGTIFPYWIRRSLFYATLLLLLPIMCGLRPFASPAEWKDHFSLLAVNLMITFD